MKEILLDSQCIIACKSRNIGVYVAVLTALFCEVLLISTLKTVLVGVSDGLHYENSICQLDLAVAVSVSLKDVISWGSSCGGSGGI